MHVSAELRWFGRDRPPQELERWFRNGPFAPGGGATRTDEYLSDPSQAELGLKTRAANTGVEIKGLVEVRPRIEQPFPGTVQIWTKWTSNALSIRDLPRVAVEKTRWVRKYDTAGPLVWEVELDSAEQLKDPSAPRVQQGCQLELSSLLTSAGEAWWTLGFEAFGSLEKVEGSLHRTLAYLPPLLPGLLAHAQESSYPGWLVSAGLSS